MSRMGSDGIKTEPQFLPAGPIENARVDTQSGWLQDQSEKIRDQSGVTAQQSEPSTLRPEGVSDHQNGDNITSAISQEFQPNVPVQSLEATAESNTSEDPLNDSHGTKVTPESKTSQPNADDDSGFIDMSLWTSHKSTLPSSNPPEQLHGAGESDYEESYSPRDESPYTDTDQDDREATRSESVEFIEEIPFAAPDNQPKSDVLASDPGSASETITVPTFVPDAGVMPYEPAPIAFLEGAKELEIFPPELYQQLRAFCYAERTQYPSIIKTKWPVSTLFETAQRQRSWFESSVPGDELLQARYLYSRNGQIVVVKQPAGSRGNFNQGRAAIVLHHSSGSGSVVRDGKTCTQHRWNVWDPFGVNQATLYVWRIMLHPRYSLLDPRTERQSQSVVPAAPVQPDGIINQQGKRPSTANDSEGPSSKRTRPEAIFIERSLLKANYPITHPCGAKRDAKTGEIILRRHSDHQLVVLRCPECDLNTVDTQQGLLNHLMYAHGLHVRNREAIVDLCGIPLMVADASNTSTRPIIPKPMLSTFRLGSNGAQRPRNLAPRPAQSYSIPHPSSHVPAPAPRPPPPPANQPPATRRTSQRLASPPPASSSQTPTRRRTSQRLATPPQSVDPPDHSGEEEAHFVFKKSDNDRKPRIRTVSSINSAEKLWVNAIVGGVARKDTLMLTVSIEGIATPLQIVKNDHEDFEMVMEQIAKSKYKNADVYITAEDWDE